MSEFHDHPVKVIIRENWCKPLIKFIHEQLGYKLVYLGLPGIQLLDVISWKEYLEKVIAFDCGDYNEPPDPEKTKENIELLANNLRKLEREGVLKSYTLYQGYIEKVVLKGLDDKGNKFTHSDFVTIYNLDFCNPLTVPIEIDDGKGNYSPHYKTEVISKLLEYERDFAMSNDQKKFLMFLTIHSDFWEAEARKMTRSIDSIHYKKYLKSVSKLNDQDKKIRLLKLYVFFVIKNHFCDRHFIPDFLTPIYYKGRGGNWLICFTIIGTYCKNPSGYAPFSQDINDLLTHGFLTATSEKIIPISDKAFGELDSETDPVELFCKTITSSHWRKKK